MKRTASLGVVLLGLSLLVFLVMVLACMPQEEPVARSYSCAVYTEQGCAKFVVASGGEIEVQSGGTVDFQSGATVGLDDITVSGSLDAAADVDVGTWVNLSAQTAISVTAAAIITPTGTYQPLTSGSAVTCSTTTCVSNGGETGDVLMLRNGNASDVITIDGTGANVECKTDVSLGAGDTLTLIWNGSDWNCISGYDNS